MKPEGKVIAEYKAKGAFPVQWSVDGLGRHVILYGAQATAFAKGADVEAAKEFGLCVRHAAECVGLLKA